MVVVGVGGQGRAGLGGGVIWRGGGDRGCVRPRPGLPAAQGPRVVPPRLRAGCPRRLSRTAHRTPYRVLPYRTPHRCRPGHPRRGHPGHRRPRKLLGRQGVHGCGGAAACAAAAVIVSRRCQVWRRAWAHPPPPPTHPPTSLPPPHQPHHRPHHLCRQRAHPAVPRSRGRAVLDGERR